LTQANPSATFSFNALSTACDSNPSERTVTWNFNDGSNVYQDTTAVTIESYAITATLSGDLSATVGSSVVIIMTVTNIGNKDVNSVSIEETTSTGLLSGKSISSISAQSSQAVSWTFTAPSAGTYNFGVKADSATTDPASDSFTLTVTSAGGGDPPSGGSSPSISGSFPLAVSPDEENVTNESAADDDSDELICADVITPAQNPETGECREFPTPCDVPEGWVTVDSCPSVDTELTGNLVDEIPSDEKKPSTPVIIFFVGIIAVIGFVVYRYVIANRKAAVPPSPRPSSSSPLSPPRSSSSILPVLPSRSSSSS